MRVLIVGGKAHATRTLRMAFGMMGLNQSVAAPESDMALHYLKTNKFHAVFCDELADSIDGVPFPKAARRNPQVLNQMIPIFLTCSGARRKLVEEARDEGVTDVIARPFNAATLKHKMGLAFLKPRSFIVAPDFFGPDRRSKARAGSFGESDRRARQPRKVRLAKPTDDVTAI